MKSGVEIIVTSGETSDGQKRSESISIRKSTSGRKNINRDLSPGLGLGRKNR